MLKAGDVVYRLNLKEGSVDELTVKQIINYEDGSFEFELASLDYWNKSKGCYKYKAWQQTEAEDKMKSESLVFHSLREVTNYVEKEVRRLSEELELFEQFEGQCFRYCERKKMIKFKVSDVKPYLENTHIDPVKAFNFEAFSVNHCDFISQGKSIANPFIGTIHFAYANHVPLALSPDDLWITLAQGFANHVNNNAEALRKKFIPFDGKQKLIVRRDEFTKGDMNNDWQGVFSEFSDKIFSFIGKQRDLVVADFSTTGPIERSVSEVILMEAMQEYFDYEVHTLCGIPEIILLGETKDWESIKQRFEVFAEYDLQWWTEYVIPIIDQFIAASKGNIDLSFWESIYKLRGGSGGDRPNGWVNLLYPYLYNYSTKKYNSRNHSLAHVEKNNYGYLGLSEFPTGFSTVPFIWDYFMEKIEMQFKAGFIGTSYNEEHNYVQPSIGWGIKNKGEKL